MTVALFSQAVRSDPRPDAELLTHFLAARDQSAFAALVQRHGPLVLGVCRRALGHTADADDAFQSTFLVLVHRAAALRRDALGPWLFGVAHRIARKLRWKRSRRSRTEQQVPSMPHPELAPPDPLETDELHRAFDEELANLPEEMRRAVVLCELQGVSRADAAKQLRISEGTVSSRLARARKKLAETLTKRGLGLAIPATVAVSARLAATTEELATGAVVVPVSVGTLVQEALKMMAISKLKLGAAVLAAAVGCTLLAFAADKPGVNADPPKADAKPDPAKVVAAVAGQEVTRAELAEFSAKRHAIRDMEAFLVTKLVRAEAAKRKVSVTDADIKAEIDKQAKEYDAIGGRKKLEEDMRNQYGTRAAWVEELTTQLLLAKMMGVAAEPTEGELKDRFENLYGERRTVKYRGVYGKAAEELDTLVAGWNANQPADPDADLAKLCEEQGNSAWSTTTVGRRAEGWYHGYDDEFHATAFGIAKVGDYAVWQRKRGGVYVVKLTDVQPPAKGADFEKAKKVMAEQVRPNKLEYLTIELTQSLVDPVRDKFYLDILKEFAPAEYEEWKKELEKPKK